MSTRRTMSTTDTERRRRRNIMIVAVLVPLLILVVVALVLGGSAGVLPWQPEPTRIPITPFADIPGFSAPAATPIP